MGAPKGQVRAPQRRAPRIGPQDVPPPVRPLLELAHGRRLHPCDAMWLQRRGLLTIFGPSSCINCTPKSVGQANGQLQAVQAFAIQHVTGLPSQVEKWRTRRNSSSSRVSEPGWCCSARSRIAIFFSASAASADARPRAPLQLKNFCQIRGPTLIV